MSDPESERPEAVNSNGPEADVSNGNDEAAEEKPKASSGRRSYKYEDPPVIFIDVDVSF